MRTIYFVVHPQLEDIDGIKETNGWKDISAYQIKDGRLEDLGYVEAHLTDDSQEVLLEFLGEEISSEETLCLVEL